MNFFKKIIPLSVKKKIKPLLYTGKKHFCPCCEKSFRKLLNFGNPERINVRCPFCHSLERHRLLILFLKNQVPFFSEKINVLEFAPYEYLQKIFKSDKQINHISCDLNSKIADINFNIKNIPFKDGYFDCVLCYHVLEHVVEDTFAIKELCRILKPNGWAIIQVPINICLENTDEDINITSKEDRKKRFGQEDHVRTYGQDFYKRLESQGFIVQKKQYIKSFSNSLVKYYNLDPKEIICFCKKK
jgi:SAM-dependent methyltransferase